ncbi:MAG: helix-turn-helix domain-containing protein [Pseudomonadota bacterium]
MSQPFVVDRRAALSDTPFWPSLAELRARFARQPKPSPVFVYWILFSSSASMAILHFFLGAQPSPLATALALGSCVTCGFGWLLARSLFKPEPRFEPWPIALVALLFAMAAMLEAARIMGAEPRAFLKITQTLASLLSSTVLVLTGVEAIDGAARRTSRGERRFQIAFLAGYGLLLSGGMILFRSSLDIPGLQEWKDAGQTFCAFLAIFGAGAAARYRLRHPLGGVKARKKKPVSDAEVDALLLDRLQHQLITQRCYLEPDVKVADVAERLGVPEYKVSQCVTRGLGFANFNQLLNHYRLEEAKRRLADRSEDKCPILTIALESGFGSVGPFNRAFKAQEGMTPGAFRTQSRKRQDAAA